MLDSLPRDDYGINSRVQHVENQLGEFLQVQGAMQAQLVAQSREVAGLREDIKAIAGKLDGVGKLDGKTLLSIISTGIAAIAVSVTVVGYVGSLALEPINDRIEWNTSYFTERTKNRFTAEQGESLHRRIEANIDEDAKKHAILSERIAILETLVNKTP